MAVKFNGKKRDGSPYDFFGDQPKRPSPYNFFGDRPGMPQSQGDDKPAISNNKTSFLDQRGTPVREDSPYNFMGKGGGGGGFDPLGALASLFGGTSFFHDKPGNNTEFVGGFGIPLPDGSRFGISPQINAGGNSLKYGRGQGVSKGMKRGGGKAPAGPAEVVKDLAYYLKMAQEYAGDSGGPDYDILRQQLGQNAIQSDARLKAMYDKLVGDIGAQKQDITNNHAQAETAIQNSANDAAQGIQQGYDAARQAQTQQLDALGIEDAAGVLNSQPTNAATDQGFQNASVERVRQNYSGANQNNAAIGRTYNDKMAGATGMQGGEARSALQGNLGNALAELAFRESEERGSAKSNILNIAQQLMSMDQSVSPQGGMSQEDQQALAEFLYGQQNDTRQLYYKYLEMYGGDTQKAAQAFAQAQAAGVA